MKTTLLQKISNYENWISSGCKGELKDDFQKELFKLASHSKDAYTFYRNYLYKKSIELNGLQAELDEFIQFLNENNNLPEHSDLVNNYSLDSTIDTFDNKRMNVTEIASETRMTGISQMSCFLYQSYYEIETVLLVLASFGVLNNESRYEVDFNNLKDRSGNLKKGVCVDFIKAKLRNYPKLLKFFTSAYNPKLRNTIGHNNYKINNDCIESLDSSISIDKSEFIESIYNLQKLNNFLIYYFSTNSVENEKLKDVGVLSVGFATDNENPVLVLHQLECFYHIDSSGKWLTNVEFKLSKDTVETNLSTKSKFTGPNLNLDTWFDKLKGKDNLTVVIEAIRPPVIERKGLLNLDCGQFETCGVRNEIKLDYKIIN